MLHYTIRPLPRQHQWHISLVFTQANDIPQILKLPNWVPGSYTIRDFSRHIIRIQAQCNGRDVALTQQNKNTWQTPAQSGTYRIDYWVYANDLSVRASLLDNERGFIDGSCLFLYLPEYTHKPHTLAFRGLPENWRIVTTLPSSAPNTFQAADYSELTDCPLELGESIEVQHFEACGIPHRIALSGHYPDFDRNRLIADCRAICEYHIRLFGRPAPFTEYLFLLHLGDKLYGGLEHLNSTALHADRHSLPQSCLKEADPAYTQLLGLISHEYFHAWNVKSIKPAAFIPYDLDKETHTELLWAFEGITSYYDDLALVRSGVITTENYLNLLAQNITRVWRNGGRKHQTLAESSFAAWHKYYKQDENSPNAITSYYQQGALAALCLDIEIRRHGKHSLDSVMRELYRRWQSTQQGIGEQQWPQLIREICGINLHDFFQAALYSTADLPLQNCLKHIGLELRFTSEPRSHNGALVKEFPETQAAADLGCRFKQTDEYAVLSHVSSHGASEAAGLQAGDKIIAVNRYACTDFNRQACTQIHDTHTVHYFRHGVLRQTQLTVQPAPADTALLRISDTESLNNWLGSTLP